jgi:hypothetical protein
VSELVLDHFGFDREQHLYTINSIVVPSVTQVLEEERFVDFSRVPHDTLEAAKARGTYVHTVLHYYLTEGPDGLPDYDLNDCAPQFRGYVDSALAFLDQAQLRPHRDAEGKPNAVEFRFWDERRMFAGTMDYVAWDADGILGIYDWKTGEPSDVAAPLQTAAYEYGLRLRLALNHKHRILRRAVKLFRDGRPGKPEPYSDPRDQQMFFNALNCVHFRRNHCRHA